MNYKRQVLLNCNFDGTVPIATAVYSLLKAADPSKPLSVHIICDRRFQTEGGADAVRKNVARFPFATVEFHDFTPFSDKYGTLLTDDPPRWPPETWGWCFCAEAMPEVTGNIVFIDWDTYVCQDLEELYSLDLEGDGFVAAAINEGARSERPDLEECEWPKEAGPSVNTGVQVLNVDAFRSERIVEKILDWQRKYKARSMCIEQDAMNVVCGTRIKRLHPKWNFFVGWAERPIRMNPFRKIWRVNTPKAVCEAVVNPGILHFISGRKPWHYTHTPYRNLYRKALIETGVIAHDLPGETGWRKWVEGPFFDAYHAFIWLYVRLLLATLFRRTRG